MAKARAEVHFHENNTVSCDVTDTCVGDDYRASSEISLWAHFAAHQLANSGPDAQAFASSLVNLPGTLGPMAASNGDLPLFLQHPGTSTMGFEAEYIYGRKDYGFRLDMIGGDLMGDNRNEYYLASIRVLLCHLAQRRHNSKTYIAALESLAHSIGNAFVRGDITPTTAYHQALFAYIENVGVISRVEVFPACKKRQPANGFWVPFGGQPVAQSPFSAEETIMRLVSQVGSPGYSGHNPGLTRSQRQVRQEFQSQRGLHAPKDAKCFVCGRSASTMHHIVPVSKSGTNERENMVCLCSACHEEIHPWMKDSAAFTRRESYTTIRQQTCPHCGKNSRLGAPCGTYYAKCPNCQGSVYIGP